MSYPTVLGTAVEGILHRPGRVSLGPKWALSYYVFYLTGTTTAATIYQNGALTIPFASNQVTADAYGRFPAIYLDPSVTYRVRFFNSSGVQQWQSDPYSSQLSTVGTSALSAYGFQIAPTGEVTLDAPNTGGSGVTLTLNAGTRGSVPLKVTATLPGNSAIIVNNSATTGAQTATFTATNKPGTAASSPAGWLPITCDGVQYYTPIWHGNPFTPYTASSGAIGEIISGTSATFGGSGLTTVVGGTAVPSNWFAPTSTGVGAGYYINITRTGGTTGVNFSVAQGTWTNIGAGGLTISSTGGGTVNGTYQLSTSVSGSPVVANGTISLGSFSQTDTYTSGTGATETVPTGASHLQIVAYGPGGSGSSSTNGNAGATGLYGGGGGAYVVLASIAVTGGNTLTYTVGQGAAAVNGGGISTPGNTGVATTVTGTVSGGAVSISAGAGHGGGVTAGGAGGVASGGTTNTNGTAGGSVSGGAGAGPSGGAGGSTNGAAGSALGGGGAGNSASQTSGAGAGGQVQFIYS